MPELTDEQISYAYKYVECKIRQRHIIGMTIEDLEDIQQYCLRKLVRKWRLWNPRRTTWKTYMVICLRSAVLDAVKWHWRQHQRLLFDELDEKKAEDIPSSDKTVEDVIDELFDDALTNKVCRMKWKGMSQRQVCKECGVDRETYEGIMQRIHDVLSGGGR